MRTRFRLLTVAGAMAAATLGISPMLASADSSPEADVDAVVFQGDTTSLTCAPLVTPPPPTVFGCDGNDVPAVGGQGTFSFSTTAVSGDFCLGISVSAGVTADEGGNIVASVDAEIPTVPPVPPASNCTITASGSYINVVCGTGIVGPPVPGGTSSATIAEGGGSDTYNATNYTIVFVGGVGVVADVPNPETSTSLTETENGVTSTEPGAVAAGVVLLRPNAAGLFPDLPGSILANPTNPNAWDFGCVHGFTVVGALVATI